MVDLIWSTLLKSFHYSKEKLATYDFLITDILVLQHKEENTAIILMEPLSNIPRNGA
jgi:hypothetical protein